MKAATDPTTAWVDTAPNYLGGRAQPLLAPVLAQHPLQVSTKVRFLTGQSAKDAVSEGAITSDDAEHGHCLSSPYVHWQCARNRTELGRDRLDLVFAHNPERTIGGPYEALRDTFTAFARALDGEGPIPQVADLGWQVYASAPLFGSDLPHLATRELTALLNPDLTAVQACLLAAAPALG
ncbi:MULTISPECIES: aldo/keto reductase [Streptomyces]|uniref:aldo/keto reductase n=1 Tax=Streptomyces TaxID=1883 RepID=UPI00224902D4|nr:aldo/keto reductase [Streptomyces sp. JHD 1]MCX2968186.1 aldo/keto reductase [Streptomyces sp. JHD 1]